MKKKTNLGECTFQYDLETLSWLPVTECAQAANFALLYIVIILTIVSTFVNSLTFLRITRDLVGWEFQKEYFGLANNPQRFCPNNENEKKPIATNPGRNNRR